MNLFDGLILNVILISFPILMYTLYEAYIKNIGREEKELFLDFSLLTSLYLILKFGYRVDNIMLLSFNVVLMLSLIKKRKVVSVICIIYSIIHYYYYLKFNIFLLIFEYLLYLILLIFNRKGQIQTYILLIYFMVIKSVFFYIQIATNKVIFINNFYIFISILLFYSVAYLSVVLFDMGEDIIKYHMSVKELEQEKQIRTSLFKITHEIKNPIAVVSGYLEMFDVNNLEHSKKYVPIIKEEIDRTLVLLHDFLSFTKVNIEKDIMDINMLLEDVYNNFKLALNDKNIQFDLDITDDEIFIEGDYNRLTQVMINLIKNSIESIGLNGKIIVKSEVINDFIYITVEDNGCGISKENLKKLNEPFFTTKQNGTGLGVCLSREIIKAHGGSISYKSTEGVGTSVKIKLKEAN